MSPLYTIKHLLYSIGGIFVKEFQVRFRGLRDVQDFVSFASTLPFKLLVGNDRFQVHATSFMGLFALNCRMAQKVMVDCTDEEFAQLLQQAARFLDT